MGLSHVPELLPGDGPTPAAAVEVPETTAAGVTDRTVRLAYEQWHASESAPPRQGPIIYLHGSPGSASNFDELAPLLAERGYRGIAPDLPGFGDSTRWVADYSIRAHARAVLVMMDELGIDSAHLVVWSMGGGVALNMADIAPERIRSISLIAAIAAQETEGSGDYLFEHAKYGLGYLAFVVGGELVPIPWHQDRWARHSFFRNFFDTDQRPLRGIMERLDTPTLILQGRQDPLVPYWAAEVHHDLIGPSRLVMLDASHFLPFLQAEQSAGFIEEFLGRVEAGEPIEATINLAPEPTRTPVVALARRTGAEMRSWHWTIQAGLFALLGSVSLTPAIAIAGLLRATHDVNIAVSLIGLLLARAVARTRLRNRPHRLVLHGVGIWGLSIGAWLVGATIALPLADRGGAAGLLLGFLLVCLVVHVLRHVWTRERRQRGLGALARTFSHEFWPGWVFYAPLAPWLFLLSIRYRHPLAFTCVNPGISHGGGVAGESKIEILEAIDDPAVLEARVIEGGPTPAERSQAALAIIRDQESLGGFPIILKPLAGERGWGVRVASSPEDVSDYFHKNPLDAIVQRYDPGPVEVGVLWVRDPDAEGPGRIFSVTIKDAATVIGDGRRTVRELILADSRHRCRADLYLDRMAGQLGEVPVPGEAVEIGPIGNHIRGANFSDGAHLITKELGSRIDRIAQSLRGRDGGGLDYGRFDIRAPSLDAVARGESLAIVELNGALAESTNLYEPSRSALWAYAVLFRQWALLYRLGAWRRRLGAHPMDPVRFVTMVARHHRAARRAQAAMLRR